MMLSSLLLKQRGVATMRAFSTAVSASSLGSVKREDVVASSDPKWIGTFAKAVMESGD